MSAGWTLLAVDEGRTVHALAIMATRATAEMRRDNLVKLQHRHEGLLRNLDRTNALHPLLAFFLLLQQLAFARDVTAIAVCRDLLPHRRNRLAGDHLAADRRLQRHDEHLPRNDRLELLYKFAALYLCLAAVRD